MAGSYRHATTDDGRLRNWRTMAIATENQGDAYETIEEMYGMIWWLADGDADRVEQARLNYQQGLNLSPGSEPIARTQERTEGSGRGPVTRAALTRLIGDQRRPI